MRAPGKPYRGRWAATRSVRLAAVAAALAMSASGCLGPDPEATTSLRFQNPELTAGLDSLNVLGINARKGDTLPIRRWRKGQDFPATVPYPPGLEAAFTMLVRGYIRDILVYQSRTAIAGGKAQPQVRDFRLVAPALPDLPVVRTARVGDSVDMEPVWESRPGIYRQSDSGAAETYTLEADFSWSRAGQLLGRDSALVLRALTREDSGTYVFLAENSAGRDSLRFDLTVKHMLPKIGKINAQAAIAGTALKVAPLITRSDALLYRWMRNGLTASTDTILRFDSLAARDTGTYQLWVANVSDTTESALSNRFAVNLAIDPAKIWGNETVITMAAQANSSYGTTADLDVPHALKYDDAKNQQGALDLLFVFSGGGLKLMSPLAAKRAKDLTYESGFDSTKLQDVKFVSANDKPPSPADGKAIYEKGPQSSSVPAQLNPVSAQDGPGYLVKTPDGKIAWIKVGPIQNGVSDASWAKLTVSLAPYPAK